VFLFERPRGGKNARERALIAVARKRAVLLHKLWISGEEYEPLRIANAKSNAAVALKYFVTEFAEFGRLRPGARAFEPACQIAAPTD